MAARTRNIPAHLGVAAAGVEFQDASDAAKAALNAFGSSLAQISPIAFAYQGYAGNRAMFGITVERVSQAIVGELSVADAMERATTDLEAAMAQTN